MRIFAELTAVQNRHQHISIVCVATLQRHLEHYDVLDIGCNNVWRLGLLGSNTLLIEAGVKAFLEEVLASLHLAPALTVHRSGVGAADGSPQKSVPQCCGVLLVDAQHGAQS